MTQKLLLTALGVMLAAISGFHGPSRAAAQDPAAAIPQTPPAKTIRVNGVELTYVEQGQGEPVVLIHGFLHDYRVWSAQMGPLSQNYRVIAYSMRYRWPGKPPADGSALSPSTNLDDLVALIRQLNLGPAHLIGHSAGAGLALRVARDHPELVRSLVLGEPGPNAFALGARAPGSPPAPGWPARAREAYESGDTEGALRIVVEGVAGKEAAAQPMPSWVWQMLRDNAWQLGRLGTRGEREPPLTCEQARQIKVPTLLLSGERSPANFRPVLEGLEKCLPTAGRAVLPNSSHGLELDNPAGFNEIVLGFLDGQPRPR